MQLPPASVLKSWPAPNHVDPETRGNANIILNVVLFSLLLCFVGVRIFSRTSLNCAFGADDILSIISVVRPLCEIEMLYS